MPWDGFDTRAERIKLGALERPEDGTREALLRMEWCFLDT